MLRSVKQELCFLILLGIHTGAGVACGFSNNSTEATRVDAEDLADDVAVVEDRVSALETTTSALRTEVASQASTMSIVLQGLDAHGAAINDLSSEIARIVTKQDEFESRVSVLEDGVNVLREDVDALLASSDSDAATAVTSYWLHDWHGAPQFPVFQFLHTHSALVHLSGGRRALYIRDTQGTARPTTSYPKSMPIYWRYDSPDCTGSKYAGFGSTALPPSPGVVFSYGAPSTESSGFAGVFGYAEKVSPTSIRIRSRITNPPHGSCDNTDFVGKVYPLPETWPVDDLAIDGPIYFDIP